MSYYQIRIILLKIGCYWLILYYDLALYLIWYSYLSITNITSCNDCNIKTFAHLITCLISRWKYSTHDYSLTEHVKYDILRNFFSYHHQKHHKIPKVRWLVHSLEDGGIIFVMFTGQAVKPKRANFKIR